MGGRRDPALAEAGDLGGVVADYVAQDENGALAGRQQLQGSHERQRDGLGGLVPGLGAGRVVR